MRIRDGNSLQMNPEEKTGSSDNSQKAPLNTSQIEAR